MMRSVNHGTTVCLARQRAEALVELAGVLDLDVRSFTVHLWSMFCFI